LQKQLKDSP